MDFGIFVPCHRMDDSVSTREVYDQALETVRLADDAGFRIAWFPEHHLIHYYSCLHAQIEEQIAELKPARRPRWAVSRMTFVGETTAEALQAMEVVQISHRIFTHLFRNQATVKGGFTVPDPVDDEYPTETLLANLVAGTPEACVEKLRMYERLGVDHFIVYGAIGTEHTRTMKSLRRFAERVMPHFKPGGAQ